MSADPAPELLAPADYARLVPHPQADANKYSRGALAVIGGSRDYPGAPVLAAKAAARCGAGYVRLAMPADAALSARAHVLSIPVTSCAQSPEGALCRDSVPEALAALGKSRALVIGPGLGTGGDSLAFLSGLLAGLAQLPRLETVVLDADALNLVARNRGLITPCAGLQLIMTPHEGEAARLLGRPVQDRLADARALAAQLGATVVLKGPRTLTVAPDGTAVQNICAGPELAKAGTGDVLAGMTGAFAAQGMQPGQAAALAVFLHGRTGRLLAGQMSVNAVMPEDIIEHIGFAIQSLEDDNT